MRKILPFAMATLILFSSCVTEESKTYVPETTSTIKEMKNFAAEKEIACAWLEQDDHLLLVMPIVTYADNNGILAVSEGEFTVRLVDLYGDFDSTIICAIPDEFIVFNMIEDYAFKVRNITPRYPINLSLNSGEKTAVLQFTQNIFRYDFGDTSYTVETRYSKEYLEERELVAENSAYKAYSTHVAGIGDSSFGDLVVFENTTGDIWYLNPYENSFINAIFIDNSTLLVVNPDNIYLHDLSRRTTSTNVPKFEFGVSTQNKWEPFYYIIGATYDREAKETILAYRESQSDDSSGIEPSQPLFLAIFDDTGSLTKQIDTELKIQPYILHSFLNKAEINIKGNGTAELSASFTNENSEVSTVILGEVDYRK